MKVQLLSIWESLRTSLWFFPVIMVSCTLASAAGSLYLDRHVHLTQDMWFSYLYLWSAEGARTVLSTMAGSMISVAGLAFSITIVALTLASTQFGPRLLRNFTKDRSNQFVLGAFISTFIFCVLVLRSVKSIEPMIFIPHISATIAMIFLIGNIIILIYFIHHVATMIQAERVIANVFNELMDDFSRLYPENETKSDVDEAKRDELLINLKDKSDHSRLKLADKNGYLQAINETAILHIAEAHQLVIETNTKPGDFIVQGNPLFSAYSSETIPDDVLDELSSEFYIGQQRTPEQDPEFALNQLVEVAARALSPGINDPFTAIQCIDHLSAALKYLTTRQYPSKYTLDDEGSIRFKKNASDFAGAVNVCFDQIRQYSINNIAVTIRLLEGLQNIAQGCTDASQLNTLARQADIIVEQAKTQSFHDQDFADIKNRYEQFESVIKQSKK